MKEKTILDKNGGLSIEFTISLNGQDYSLVTPTNPKWLEMPDVLDLVRKSASDYFNMLRAL